MVALISKAEIEGKNIDTVEKAIAFGALALRSALIGADNSQANDRKVSIRISPSRESPSYLSIDIYLPYDAYSFNTTGGLALQSLGELTSNSLSLENDLILTSQETTSSLVMPDYDEVEINTFEKYIFYYARILWASLAEKRNNIVKINPQGNQDNSEFFIDLSLPINLDIWLFGKNYLDALESAVDAYLVPGLEGNIETEIPLPVEFNEYIEQPDAEAFYQIFIFPFPGDLLSIEFDADFIEDYSFESLEFYLDEDFIPFDLIETGENGFFSYSWAIGTDTLFVPPGSTLSVYLFPEDQPSYLDVYIRVIPFSQ